MGNLKVGAAKINITPPLGCDLAGYAARNQASQTVADELYAKALVFDDGNTQATIITNDLLGLDASYVDDVRQLITEVTGIPAKNVMISCSHTHFGPQVRAASENPINRVYTEQLRHTLKTVVQLAQQGLQPARIGAGEGVADNVSYNRHTLRPDGKAVTTYRLPAQNTDVTFGPYDPTVRVLRVDNGSGNPLATLVHFACHPVTTVDRMYTITADYPGYAMNVVETQDGGICLFGLGCAGNIVPIQREGDYPRMIGKTIGGEAVKALQWLKTTDEARIRVAHRTLTLKRREPKDSQMSEELNLQAIAIGDIHFIGLPGEIFVEFGFDIVRRSRLKHLFVMSMTNGSIGYIPTEIAFAQGGYESGSSHFQPGCGEQLADAAVDLLSQMRGFSA